MLVWFFVKRCLNVKSVFDIVEKEFYIRGILKLRNEEFLLILWFFVKLGNLSVEFFNVCYEEIFFRDMSLFKVY